MDGAPPGQEKYAQVFVSNRFRPNLQRISLAIDDEIVKYNVNRFFESGATFFDTLTSFIQRLPSPQVAQVFSVFIIFIGSIFKILPLILNF